jgi:hypothetical protein
VSLVYHLVVKNQGLSCSFLVDFSMRSPGYAFCEYTPCSPAQCFKHFGIRCRRAEAANAVRPVRVRGIFSFFLTRRLPTALRQLTLLV